MILYWLIDGFASIHRQIWCGLLFWMDLDDMDAALRITSDETYGDADFFKHLLQLTCQGLTRLTILFIWVFKIFSPKVSRDAPEPRLI